MAFFSTNWYKWGFLSSIFEKSQIFEKMEGCLPSERGCLPSERGCLPFERGWHPSFGGYHPSLEGWYTISEGCHPPLEGKHPPFDRWYASSHRCISYHYLKGNLIEFMVFKPIWDHLWFGLNHHL